MNTPDFYNIAYEEALCFYRLKMYCTHDDKEAVSCTKEFYEQGFFKNLVWDNYAEYHFKCKNCPHFRHDVGFYYGNGNHTNNFDEKRIFNIEINNTEDLNRAVTLLPKHTKSIWLSSNNSIDYSAIAELSELETVCISMSKNIMLWNICKTPNLQVLEFNVGTAIPDLSVLKNASQLQHLGLIVHMSQINNSVMPSFNIFKEIPHLESLTLSGITSENNDINDLIEIPNLKRLWISPNIFTVDDYAKFEALKFKIGNEYGIYDFDEEQNEYYPYGKGKRRLKNKQAKGKFLDEYKLLMEKYLQEKNESI